MVSQINSSATSNIDYVNIMCKCATSNVSFSCQLQLILAELPLIYRFIAATPLSRQVQFLVSFVDPNKSFQFWLVLQCFIFVIYVLIHSMILWGRWLLIEPPNDLMNYCNWFWASSISLAWLLKAIYRVGYMNVIPSTYSA